MILCFPTPFADEAFYSLEARYANRMRYPSPTDVFQDLFGKSTLTAVVDFPCQLRHFMAELLPGHPCGTSKLLREHTFLPWYAPFQPPERVSQLREAILASGGSGIWSRIGLNGGRVPVPPFLRFCPVCLREDLNSSGEPYWRRLHQLAGIEICPKHRVFLENSSFPRIKQSKRAHFELPSQSFLKDHPRYAGTTDEPLIRLALLGGELLSTEWPTRGLERLRSDYVRLLRQAGYTARNGSPRVCIQRLHQDLRDSYSAGLLARLGCHTDHWLMHLVRSSDSIQPPIRHLLLLSFLGASLRDFFGEENLGAVKPPEKSNIACQNNLCPVRGTQVAVFVREEFSNPMGGYVEFYRCETCGQTRLRCLAGHERTWIRDYGFLWKKKLTQLWNDPSLGFRQMMRILGCSADTVKSQALKTGLAFPRPGRKRTSILRFKHLLRSKSTVLAKKIEHLRTRWLSVWRRNAGDSIRKLRIRAPAVYASLYRYDRAWLKANQPIKQQWWPKGKQSKRGGIRRNRERELELQQQKDPLAPAGSAAGMTKKLPKDDFEYLPPA